MLQDQDQKCAICQLEIDESCHVDHCHDTEVIRGLLCNGCNTGIGMLKDNPEILEEAGKVYDENGELIPLKDNLNFDQFRIIYPIPFLKSFDSTISGDISIVGNEKPFLVSGDIKLIKSTQS